MSSAVMKHLKAEDDGGDSEENSKGVEEEGGDDGEEGEKSNVMESGGDGFSLTVDGMSSSIAMSFQWLDKVCGITPTSRRGQTIINDSSTFNWAEICVRLTPQIHYRWVWHRHIIGHLVTDILVISNDTTVPVTQDMTTRPSWNLGILMI